MTPLLPPCPQQTGEWEGKPLFVLTQGSPGQELWGPISAPDCVSVSGKNEGSSRTEVPADPASCYGQGVFL